MMGGYTPKTSGMVPRSSAHTDDVVAVVGWTVSDHHVLSGGMWITRAVDDDDVRAMLSAVAIHPSDVLEVHSQVVAGVRYRVHRRDGALPPVHVHHTLNHEYVTV
jgi:hypothetical protein